MEEKVESSAASSVQKSASTVSSCTWSSWGGQREAKSADSSCSQSSISKASTSGERDRSGQHWDSWCRLVPSAFRLDSYRRRYDALYEDSLFPIVDAPRDVTFKARCDFRLNAAKTERGLGKRHWPEMYIDHLTYLY